MENAASVERKWRENKAARERRNQQKCIRMYSQFTAAKKKFTERIASRQGDEAAARAVAVRVEQDFGDLSDSDPDDIPERVDLNIESGEDSDEHLSL